MTKTLDSTAVYAYTTLISMLVCSPFMFIMEGSQLAAGAQAAIAKVGAQRFYTDLFMVGLLYHLYNQFAFNTLQRVSPVSHGVCNVVKRVVIIFSSVIFFNQVLTTQVGHAVATQPQFGRRACWWQQQQPRQQRHWAISSWLAWQLVCHGCSIDS